MNHISAGIVLYNPEIKRLKKNIDAISQQVDIVYCFNNGSKNLNEIQKLISNYSNVTLIDGKENLGISVALNRMAETAETAGSKWLLSLDQDSVCPDDMIQEFTPYQKMEEVGIICPFFVDKRRPQRQIPTEPYSEVDDTITSGALMNLDIYKKLGGSDEYLFIGLVDDEYCYRLRLNHYKIIQINTVLMDHELGKVTTSKHANFYRKLGKTFHSHFFEKLTYQRAVSPMRVYYSTRNMLYCRKKYKGHQNRLWSMKHIVYNAASNIIRGQEKGKIVLAVIRGFKDARRKNVKPYVTN